MLARAVAGAESGDRPTLGPFAIAGDERPAIMVSLGVFDFAHEESRGTQGDRLAGRVELRGGWKLFALGPLVGVAADSDRGLLGYGGLYFEASAGRWSVIPAGTFGRYRRGDSKDLGGPVLFQAELTGAYRLDGGIGLGLTFVHVSNGYRYDRNPGAESLLATVLVPF